MNDKYPSSKFTPASAVEIFTPDCSTLPGIIELAKGHEVFAEESYTRYRNTLSVFGNTPYEWDELSSTEKLAWMAAVGHVVLTITS